MPRKREGLRTSGDFDGRNLASGKLVEIDLTFTATACPCMDFIHEDIRERLLKEGEIITIDGATGEVMLGAIALVPGQLDDLPTLERAWGASAHPGRSGLVALPQGLARPP